MLLLLKIMFRNDQDKNHYNKVYLFVHNKTVLLNSYIMNAPQIKHESNSTLLEILLVMKPSWSYGSWNYNYLCNQRLLPQILSSNPVHGEVYSIQHYVIKFVSNLRQVGYSLRVLRFPPPIKLTTTI